MLQKMKRAVLLLFLVLMFILLPCNWVSAAETAQKNFVFSENAILSPCYVYTNSIQVSLSISGGSASCRGTLQPSGNYNASVTASLYKKVNGSWSLIASWYGSATNGGSAIASGSKKVSSGEYKLVVNGVIKNSSGQALEYSSASMTKTY